MTSPARHPRDTAYLFVAAKSDGGRSVGVLKARDRRQLSDNLRRDRKVVLRTWTLPAWVVTRSAMSLKDQAEVHTQLAQLLTRGVPLVESLDVTASGVSAAARPRVERLREMVAAGSSFADACQSVEGFDPVTIAVYRAAERSGDLGGAARQLSTTARRQMAVSGKVVTLLVYPTIVLAISILVSVLMLTVIVPKIGAAMLSANVPLPSYSVLTFKVGMFMRDNIAWLGIGAVALIACAVVFRKAIWNTISGVLRRMPLVKQVVAAQELTRFFTVMAAMSRSGVTFADSLGVATGAVTHPVLQGQLMKLRNRLIEGGILRNLIEDVDSFPMATRRLLIAAERSGDLQSVFETLSGDMAEEVDRRSARLLAALEPGLIVLMFLMIGSLLLSIMVPLMNITNQVG